MAEMKYAKYILTDLHLSEEQQKGEAEYAKRGIRVFWLEDFVIEGAPSVICSWYTKATEEPGTIAHIHDFDEVVGLLGGDPDNPYDLGGEVEFWIEDEKYMLTKSCLIFCPKGVKHCPLHVRKVTRPIMFLAFSTTLNYKKILDAQQ